MLRCDLLSNLYLCCKQRRYSALALKNIQASLMFLARLFVSLTYRKQFTHKAVRALDRCDLLSNLYL